MIGGEFCARHCGLSAGDEKKMLRFLGLETLDDLSRALPADIAAAPREFDPPLTENEAHEELRKYAAQNDGGKTSMIGLGYYGAQMPAALRRNLFENPDWYTAYTPYQAEISQGRLELLFHFQTMCAELTGLPMANASLLDEATAAAEAMTLLHRKGGGNVFLVDDSLFPQTLAVLRTRASPLGIELRVLPPKQMADNCADAFGAIIGYPGGDGGVADWRKITAALKQNNIAAACATDLLALTLLTPPGEMGFDIAFGNSQRFGLPMGCGGPHAAFFAFTADYVRHAPGRVVGKSRDTQGRAGYRLALQTREQHIRREKATSNICTAQALPAMLAAAFAIYQGPERLAESAKRIHSFAAGLAAGLQNAGRKLRHRCFFDTLRVVADDAGEVVKRAADKGINLLHCANTGEVGISVDDLTTPQHLQTIIDAFGGGEIKIDSSQSVIPQELKRRSAFCGSEVFGMHRSEHDITRYLRQLADKDISLTRSMIPLGSCTMKLNAAAEMEPLAWAEFANVHPFAPAAQMLGYRKMLADLSERLAKLTGFDAVSLQPNAGAQGEYAGLLAIRAYLQSIGQGGRDVCLIPLSAHGTNPASAVMAGMRVVTVAIDDSGQADADDLAQKIKTHGDKLAALMMTYPSTSGVFAEGMPAICKRIHDSGGQVYMDGANLNALVGAALPGKMGPDVMHINLHKTFCIPHGGGGPGMGPIAVAGHLSPFLPVHPFDESGGEGCGTVSAAPFGSALILLIPWLYMRMMGGAGLRRATLTALLSANYIARRLEGEWPVQFKGGGGFVAHECIVDARQFKKTAGVSVEDVAKRLMDYGFHAPTVSWPLPGAVMIEPTESESLPEIDRFCDAMLSIAGEIKRIQDGEWPRDNNPLVNAPHTAEDLLTGEWQRSYTREQAAYPAEWIKGDKYWPPVSRIDAVYGDRELLKK